MRHNPNSRPDVPSSIWAQLAELAWHQKVHTQVIRLAERAELPPSSFWQYFHSTYLRSQAAGIRRQGDTGPRVLSLGRVLYELHRELERLGRPAWMPPSELQLTADQVKADRDKLAAELQTLKRIVDRRVAHTDHRPVRATLNTTTVDAAFNSLVEMFQRYERHLLGATTYFDLTIEDDWQAIFRRPWTPDQESLAT